MMKKILKNNLERQYFSWLCNRVDADHYEVEYGDLLLWLYTQEFYSVVPNDDNRCTDGINLRGTFGFEKRKPNAETLLEGPCSMLEMMIALADRMDYVLFDPQKDSRAAKYFWLLVSNLGLRKVTKENFDDNLNYMIIKRFLERKYRRSGIGGLFPLRNNRKDQRGVEIWYQMMTYIDTVMC